MVMDDTLWAHALRVNRLQEEHIQPLQHLLTGEERGLMRLIRAGVRDAEEVDRPMDSSIRSMRYAAIMADHLSTMLTIEKSRVSSGICRVLSIH
jgi:hypothetical protein